ncbi:unnamed protein product [Durusdinium trenchii]|uniref:Uncharacterized protein n=1 Tax=Durusdinium trenchii TaxID=1381693 RepID=A0ABP0H5H9_9DINO
MKELSKVAGAPDHETWPNIFESPPAAAMDLLFELVKDQLHGKALAEVQEMRLTGYSTAGEPLPSALVWPWKGWMNPKHDVTRIGLVLTKEMTRPPIAFQVSKYLEMRHRSGLRPAIIAFALYRHRAHCSLEIAMGGRRFPMSNSSRALCKECWYQQILRAFEMADFSNDDAMRGLQRFWLSRARLVGGRQGPSGLVFAHLVAWFPLLRAQLFGLRVLDYARLLVLNQRELRKYLNGTLPGNLIRSPGVEALARSFEAFRVDDPLKFLAKRERSYLALGAEPFARAAIQARRSRSHPPPESKSPEQSSMAFVHRLVESFDWEAWISGWKRTPSTDPSAEYRELRLRASRVVRPAMHSVHLWHLFQGAELRVKMDKSQRQIFEQMSESEVLSFALTHLQRKCQQNGMLDQMALVFVALRRHLRFGLQPSPATPGTSRRTQQQHLRILVPAVRKMSGLGGLGRLLELVQQKVEPGFRQELQKLIDHAVGRRKGHVERNSTEPLAVATWPDKILKGFDSGAPRLA